MGAVGAFVLEKYKKREEKKCLGEKVDVRGQNRNEPETEARVSRAASVQTNVQNKTLDPLDGE